MDLLRLAYRFVSQFIDIKKLIRAPFRYVQYFLQLIDFASRKERQDTLRLLDLWPILTDNVEQSSYDSHYTFLNYWAFQKINQSRFPEHVDVGSQISFVTLLSIIKPVTFVDIRPLEIDIAGITSVKGSILSLPYADGSINSLSSLHVLEHIGLGRYGDPIDPKGTALAIRELSRVLAPGGDLYVAVPTGASRICFNAHRILNPVEVVNAFSTESVTLKSFSVVTDEVRFLIDVNPADFVVQLYACGMFHFTKCGHSL